MPDKAPTFTDPLRQALLQQARQQRAKRHDKARGTPAQRGYDGRWRKYARELLAKRPHCECDVCRSTGRVRTATHVDHIIAVTGPKDPMFWRHSNHRAMAAGCHSRKTSQSDGGFGNPKRPPQAC